MPSTYIRVISIGLVVKGGKTGGKGRVVAFESFLFLYFYTSIFILNNTCGIACIQVPLEM